MITVGKVVDEGVEEAPKEIRSKAHSSNY